VSSVNSPPTAVAQTVTVRNDQPRLITLVGDDGDAAVQVLTFSLVNQPTYGTLSDFNSAPARWSTRHGRAIS